MQLVFLLFYFFFLFQNELIALGLLMHKMMKNKVKENRETKK
jgi:hypothetical protein